MLEKNEFVLYSKFFENLSLEEERECREVLKEWVEALFLSEKNFQLSPNPEKGFPIDFFVEIEPDTMATFLKEIKRQTQKLRNVNIWVKEHKKEGYQFFEFLKYLNIRKGKEEVALNLLHQNIDLEWITMVTGFSKEELEELKSNILER